MHAHTHARAHGHAHTYILLEFALLHLHVCASCNALYTERKFCSGTNIFHVSLDSRGHLLGFLLLEEEKLNQSMQHHSPEDCTLEENLNFPTKYTAPFSRFKLLKMNVFQFVGWEEGSILYSLLGSQI
jgi:hypothetical protein